MLLDLYAWAPVWLHRRLRRALRVPDAAAHEWLCPTLGCRCP